MNGVRGGLRVGNQIVEEKAHHQEDDEPLDPRHVGLPFSRSSSQVIRTPGGVYREKITIDTSPKIFSFWKLGDSRVRFSYTLEAFFSAMMLRLTEVGATSLRQDLGLVHGEVAWPSETQRPPVNRYQP
jgi:hypothetical protein